MKVLKEFILFELQKDMNFEIIDPNTDRVPANRANFEKLIPMVEVMIRMKRPNWHKQWEHIELCIFCWKFIKVDKYMTHHAFKLRNSDILCVQQLSDVFGTSNLPIDIRYLKYLSLLNNLSKLQHCPYKNMNDMSTVIDSYLPKYGAMPKMNHVCLSYVSKIYKMKDEQGNPPKPLNYCLSKEPNKVRKKPLRNMKDIREFFRDIEAKSISFYHKGRTFSLEMSGELFFASLEKNTPEPIPQKLRPFQLVDEEIIEEGMGIDQQNERDAVYSYDWSSDTHTDSDESSSQLKKRSGRPNMAEMTRTPIPNHLDSFCPLSKKSRVLEVTPPFKRVCNRMRNTNPSPVAANLTIPAKERWPNKKKNIYRFNDLLFDKKAKHKKSTLFESNSLVQDELLWEQTLPKTQNAIKIEE
jgi:hypothetical protein